MADTKEIVLGEFWVDSEDLYRFDQIQKLKRKLEQKNARQSPPLTPPRMLIGLNKLVVRAKGINHPKQYVKAYCACRAVGA